MIHNISEREKELLGMLMEDSRRSVADLSKALAVSVVTIRSDLSALAEKGVIVRTRGGAFPAFHPSILNRQKHLAELKNNIARAAADLVCDRDTIMIEAGTTTALVAKYLLGKRDIHVVTNSTLILPYARINPSLHLTVVGGAFQPATESLVGPLALRELEEFHVSAAFIGTDGFSLNKGLTTHLIEGAEIVRKMAEQARTTILVADSSKFGKVGFVRVLPLNKVSRIITDQGINRDARASIEELGISLVVV